MKKRLTGGRIAGLVICVVCIIGALAGAVYKMNFTGYKRTDAMITGVYEISGTASGEFAHSIGCTYTVDGQTYTTRQQVLSTRFKKLGGSFPVFYLQSDPSTTMSTYSLYPYFGGAIMFVIVFFVVMFIPERKLNPDRREGPHPTLRRR